MTLNRASITITSTEDNLKEFEEKYIKKLKIGEDHPGASNKAQIEIEGITSCIIYNYTFRYNPNSESIFSPAHRGGGRIYMSFDLMEGTEISKELVIKMYEISGKGTVSAAIEDEDNNVILSKTISRHTHAQVEEYEEVLHEEEYEGDEDEWDDEEDKEKDDDIIVR